MIAVVMERPESLEELEALKGMSPRLARQHGKRLLAELKRVDGLPEGDLLSYPRGVRNGMGRFTPDEEAKAEAVRDLRSARAEELGLEKGVLLSNAKISDIVRASPRSKEALEAVPGLRSWQVGLLAPEVLRILGN